MKPSKIRQLDEATIGFIAAGEVVERPAQVVKELIENSLDAGSTSIVVTVERGGFDRLEVEDNGSGISESDLPLALDRHATSKLSSKDDLASIVSLGFRGEALASIGMVSRLTISSKPEGAQGASIVMEDGLDSKLFEKFDRVFSGHYHTRSDDGKVFYLGNPYEMYWTDVNDTRGFHIFDTETLTLTPVNNPYKLFYNIYYEDTNHKLFNAIEYENKIVKVIVRKKSKPKDFEKFIDKLHSAGVQDLKIIENFEIQESEEFEIDEEENTLSILNRYIDESEFELDKSIIKGIFQDLYRQACEVE